jgi:5-methylcytosine-specific restriction endonuclease McrA
MSPRNYNDPVYKAIRLQCLKRDKKKCQMPGCNAKRRLQVHHIERYCDAASLRYELTNCIVLCKNCHDSIKDKEHHYAPLFRSIISGNS